MELANQSVLFNAPDGNLLHILKDTELYDQGLRHRNDNYLEESCKSEVGNTVTVDSDLAFKSRDMEDSSVSVLNGEYCGLATQLSIDYVDIFEILRAEILAAEAGEFDVIENELLNNDTREAESGSNESRKECTSTIVPVVDRHEGQDFTENSVLQARGILASDLALAQGDLQEDSSKTDGLISPNHESSLIQSQLNEKNGQVQLSLTAYPKGAEGTNPEKKDVDPLDNGKGEYGDGCLQNAEGKGAENLKAAPSEEDKVGVLQHAAVMSEGAGKAGSVGVCGNTEQAGQDGSSSILIVEVLGDAYSRDVLGDAYSRDADGIDVCKGSVDPTDNSKGEDGVSFLQSDKYSEHSEDEEHVPSAFSGPITFSGMLSYSGMISYSGQIPYSGNLSLHSDSSTSTRSFAFPVLASDWNSSPAKIGPPDSRYFRRRRRWRPRFCCRRPTTLFD